MSQLHFTKAGHSLEHIGNMTFRVKAQTALPGLPETPQNPQQATFLTSQLQVVPPCTRSQVGAQLRALLAVYGDEELQGQVDAVVEEAFSSLPDAAPTPTPAPPPTVPPSPITIN